MRSRALILLILALGIVVHNRDVFARTVILATVQVAHAPDAVAVAGPSGRVFVTTTSTVGGDHGSVAMLDAGTGRVMRTFDLGEQEGGPPVLAMDERRGRVYVSNPGQSGVYVLDARTGRVLRMLLPGIRGISALAVDPISGSLYAADAFGNALRLVAPASGAVLRMIRLAGSPVDLLASPRGGRVYVLSGPQDGPIWRLRILDAATGRPLAQTVVPAGDFSRLALDERTGHLFITDQGSTFHAPLTLGSVSTLDARTGSLLRTATVGYFPNRIAVDAFTGRIFVSNSQSGTVSILDSASGLVVGTVAVEGFPWGLAVSPDGRRVLVAGRGCMDGLHGCLGVQGRGAISVLDGGFGAYLGSIRAGTGPVAVACDAWSGHAFVANAGIMRPLQLPEHPIHGPSVPGSVTVLDLAAL